MKNLTISLLVLFACVRAGAFGTNAIVASPWTTTTNAAAALAALGGGGGGTNGSGIAYNFSSNFQVTSSTNVDIGANVLTNGSSFTKLTSVPPGMTLTNTDGTVVFTPITTNIVGNVSSVLLNVTAIGGSIPTNTMTVYAASNAAPGSALALALTNLPAGVVTNGGFPGVSILPQYISIQSGQAGLSAATNGQATVSWGGNNEGFLQGNPDGTFSIGAVGIVNPGVLLFDGNTVSSGNVSSNRITSLNPAQIFPAIAGYTDAQAISNANAAVASRPLPLANATGTLPAAALPAGVVTNDPTVQSFIAAAGITDQATQTRLYVAINNFKQSPVTSNLWPLLDVRLFQACYNPTSNVSLRGMPWTSVNPIYSPYAFQFYGTNSAWGVLPQTITNRNFAFAIMHNLNSAAASTFSSSANSYWPILCFLGGYANSNNAATVCLQKGAAAGVAVEENNGVYTNWANNNVGYSGNTTTNFFQPLDSHGSTAYAFAGTKINILSTTTNIHRVWENTLPTESLQKNAFYTNTWLLNTNPMQVFQVGSNANWNYWTSQGGTATAINMNSGNGYYGNTFGEDISMIVTVGTNINQQQAEALTKLCLQLDPRQNVYFSSGTSMRNPANTVGSLGGCTYTNDIAYIHSIYYPDDLVFDYAAPGSLLAYQIYPNGYVPASFTNVVPGNGKSFPFTMVSNTIAAGKSIRGWFTDDGRNDVTATSFTNSWNNFITVYTNFPSQVEITYTATPLLGVTNSTPGNGSNLWLYAHAMLTNSLVKHWVMTIDWVSTNDIHNLSYSGDHLDNFPQGYNFIVQEMQAEMNPGYRFSNPTNNTIYWDATTTRPAGDNINILMITNPFTGGAGYK